jgi:hypothetical protein
MHITAKRQNLLRHANSPLVVIALALLVGIVAGFLSVIAGGTSTKWTIAVLIVSVGPAAVLLINDLRKLVLILFAMDIPAGFDIAIPDIPNHQGGPNGFIISLMTIGLVIGYMLWIIERKPKVHFYPRTTVPMLLYLLAILFSFFLSHRLQLSAFGAFLNIQVMLMYFYMINHVQTWEDLAVVVTTSVIFLLLEGILMVSQYFFNTSLSMGAVSSSAYATGVSAGTTGSRVAGTLGAPNSAATYLAAMIPLALASFLAGNLVDKRISYIAIPLALMSIIFTSSRTGWASVFAALACVIFQAARGKKGKQIIIAALAGSLLFAAVFGPRMLPRLQAAETDRTRPELATMAYNIIRAYPLGVGENNYGYVMSDKYAHPNWVGRRLLAVHNRYLLTWAERGPQGLLAFIILLVLTATQIGKWFFRSDIEERYLIMAAGFFGMLLSYIIHMFTEGMATRANLEILFFIIALTVIGNQLAVQSINHPTE